MKKARSFTGFLIVAIILFSIVATFFAGVTTAAPLANPMIYYNDSTWAREDRCPLKTIDDEYYVPLVIFAQLDDTKVRVNNNLNTFVISHGDLYVSFDASTGIATDQDDTYLYIRTYKLDYGERYVPAKTVCDLLGFDFETYTSKLTFDVAARITDGTQESSFEELLAKYNPNMLKSEADTTTAVSDTSSEETVSTSKTAIEQPTKILGNRIIYITVDSGVNAYTGGILDTLLAYGCKATFFIDRKQITDYPLTLARIVSEGHKLALKPSAEKTENFTDIEDFIKEFDDTNELLYRIYKIKTRTVRPDSSVYTNTALSNEMYSEKLENAGYTIWNANVSRVDGIKSNDAAIETMIDAIWKNNTLVLDFGSNYQTSAVLSGTLAFINENREKCDVRLADAAYNPIK